MTTNEQGASSSEVYAGSVDYVHDPVKPQYECLKFSNPALLTAFFDPEIASGLAHLHKWQIEVLEEIGSAEPSAQHPYKLALVAANGSGKDKYVVAPFAIWFALCKIRSRVIITSSSGVQLSSQTENYIRDFAEKVNSFFGSEIFRIRQRYIYCRLSGSEIRLFATDEKGRAEGYHPWDTKSEMAIIVNEAKTVTEDIHNALRRCTGFNYWLEVSTPGEPSGFFYRAVNTWPATRRVTSYDCPHLSIDEIEADKLELGEDSQLFRSKHLALFTSSSGETIIASHVVEDLLINPLGYIVPGKKRVGLDLAAGCAENSVCMVEGSVCLKQKHFREVDTTITADRIEEIFKDWEIQKSFEHIYADDGGVGHAIIDTLIRRGWKINRVLNQWAAIKKRQYGNRGAENWYRVKRIFEERLFDVRTLDEKTREQLTSRRYKQSNTGGRIFLEAKKEAISNGRPSPDRADAFILAFCGVSLDDYLLTEKKVDDTPKRQKGEYLGASYEEVLNSYEENYTYKSFKKVEEKKQRAFCSLNAALN